VAGRVLAIRSFGKANFLVISDGRARIQVYIRKDSLPERDFAVYRLLDFGDYIGVEGRLFRTKTNELTVWASGLEFLVKCFIPLPEKWHGLSDIETRYRQRYLDLIVNPESREVFQLRSRVLAADGRERARHAAERVAALESRLGIAGEQELQRAALRFPRVVAGANAGYAVFNIGLTVGWLIHRFRTGDPGYLRLRRACVLAHLGAQPIFLLRPVAPPRTLPRIVDTLREVSGLDLEHPVLVRFYNPVAAMPSLHVAFATVTACAAAERSSSRRAGVGAFAYPTLVAVFTGLVLISNVTATKGVAFGPIVGDWSIITVSAMRSAPSMRRHASRGPSIASPCSSPSAVPPSALCSAWSER